MARIKQTLRKLHAARPLQHGEILEGVHEDKSRSERYLSDDSNSARPCPDGCSSEDADGYEPHSDNDHRTDSNPDDGNSDQLRSDEYASEDVDSYVSNPDINASHDSSSHDGGTDDVDPYNGSVAEIVNTGTAPPSSGLSNRNKALAMTTRAEELWRPGDGEGPTIKAPRAGLGINHWNSWLLYDMFVTLIASDSVVFNLPPSNVRLSDYLAGQLLSFRLQGTLSGGYLAQKWPSDFTHMGFPRLTRPNRGAPLKANFNGVYHYAIRVYYRFCGAEGRESGIGSLVNDPNIEIDPRKLAKRSLTMTYDDMTEADQGPLDKNRMGIDPERCTYLSRRGLSKEMSQRIPSVTPRLSGEVEGLITCKISRQGIHPNALKNDDLAPLKRKADTELANETHKRTRTSAPRTKTVNLGSITGRDQSISTAVEDEDALVGQRERRPRQATRQHSDPLERASDAQSSLCDLDERRKRRGQNPLEDPIIRTPTRGPKLITASAPIESIPKANIDFLLYLCGPDIKGRIEHLPESSEHLTRGERKLLEDLAANPKTPTETAVVRCLEIANGIIKEQISMRR